MQGRRGASVQVPVRDEGAQLLGVSVALAQRLQPEANVLCFLAKLSLYAASDDECKRR